MSNIILVLDSSTEILLLLKKVLGSKGKIHTVEDGASAVHFLSTNVLPALIVINPKVEVLEGYNMLHFLKSSKIYNNIPTILLSDQSEKYLQELTEEFSCVAYFKKPFDPLSLLNTVDAILN